MAITGLRRLAFIVAVAVFGLVPIPVQAAQQPDGTIVYAHQGDIYTIQPDGSAKTRLTTTGDNRTPTWSPNGKKIAFASTRTGNLDVFVIRRDGSHLRQITTDPGHDHFPDWSPDGKSLIYTNLAVDAARGHLFTVRLPHHDSEQLTFAQFSEYGEPIHNGESQASYSPDGHAILMTHTVGDLNSAPGVFLSRIRSDGSGYLPLNLPGTLDLERDGTWSPHGDRIAFAGQTDTDGPHNLYTANPDGSGLVQLTHSVEFGQAEAREPAWSPDGQSIVYNRQARTPAKSGLYIIDADGSDKRRVTEGGEPDWHLS